MNARTYRTARLQAALSRLSYVTDAAPRKAPKGVRPSERAEWALDLRADVLAAMGPVVVCDDGSWSYEIADCAAYRAHTVRS